VYTHPAAACLSGFLQHASSCHACLPAATTLFYTLAPAGERLGKTLFNATAAGSAFKLRLPRCCRAACYALARAHNALRQRAERAQRAAFVYTAYTYLHLYTPPSETKEEGSGGHMRQEGGAGGEGGRKRRRMPQGKGPACLPPPLYLHASLKLTHLSRSTEGRGKEGRKSAFYLYLLYYTHTYTPLWQDFTWKKERRRTCMCLY